MLNAAVILNWVQTVGVLAALTFTGYQLYRRNREQRFRNYLDHMVSFFDATKLLVENKDLHPLYDYSWVDIKAKSYERLTADQKARVHYCDILIGLFETVWVADRERWLAKTEWPYIKAWIRQLAESPDFRWTVEWVTDDYSEDFMIAVHSQLTEATKAASQDTVGT